MLTEDITGEILKVWKLQDVSMARPFIDGYAAPVINDLVLPLRVWLKHRVRLKPYGFSAYFPMYSSIQTINLLTSELWYG